MPGARRTAPGRLEGGSPWLAGALLALTRPDSPVSRRPALRVRFGISVHVVKLGLDAAFPVPFLLANYLSHQGCLAGIVEAVRLPAQVIAGTAWFRCSVTHGQVLLSRESWHGTLPETIVQPGARPWAHGRYVSPPPVMAALNFGTSSSSWRV